MSRRAGFCAVLLLLAACGDEERSPAESSLAEFHRAIASAQGIDDATWPALVQRAAVDLWPGTGEKDVAAQQGRKVHSDLAYIAGDVAKGLARDPTWRKALTEIDPISLEVHDGVLAASGKGIAAYRAWMEKEGTALRTRRIEALSSPPPR